MPYFIFQSTIKAQEMLLKHCPQIKSLLILSQYNFTAKSKRQTTPNLFQNPRLTKHGLVQKIPKSYDYNLPEDLPNRHLYWDRTVQNRARRQQYNKKRLQKLEVKPIHRDGVRTFDRDLNEILHELSNIRLVKASLNRTLANLVETAIRFRKQLSEEDREIVTGCIKEIHDRYLASMNKYQFSSFIQLRCLMGVPCTEEVFVHFYKFIQQFSETSQANEQNQEQEPINKFKLEVFLKIFKYVFQPSNGAFLKQNTNLLYKNRQMFKLFEDNDPREISIEELLPFAYSKSEIAQELQKPQVQALLKELFKVPGGKELYQNLTE